MNEKQEVNDAMKEEVPISCSWQDPDEEDIEKLCFDLEQGEYDPNETNAKEATDAMRCPERNLDLRLAGFASQKGADDGESNVSDDPYEEVKDLNDSENELCQTDSLNQVLEDVLSEEKSDLSEVAHVKNVTGPLKIPIKLHMSSQNYIKIRSDKKAETLKTDLQDEKGRVFCDTCGHRLHRNNLGWHFKKSKCERSLLQRGSKLKGKPWREDWEDFIPEQYQGEVAINSDEVDTEEQKKVEVSAEEDMDGEVLRDDEFVLEQQTEKRSSTRTTY